MSDFEISGERDLRASPLAIYTATIDTTGTRVV